MEEQLNFLFNVIDQFYVAVHKIKHISVLISIARLSCPISTEPGFSWQISVNISDTKFHENIPVGLVLIQEDPLTTGDMT